MLTVDNHTIDVYQDIRQSREHLSEEAMEGGLGAKDPKRCPIPLELALSWNGESGLRCLFLR